MASVSIAHEDVIHILHPSERLKGTEYGIPRDVLRGYFESDQALSSLLPASGPHVTLRDLANLDIFVVLIKLGIGFYY